MIDDVVCTFGVPSKLPTTKASIVEVASVLLRFPQEEPVMLVPVKVTVFAPFDNAGAIHNLVVPCTVTEVGDPHVVERVSERPVTVPLLVVAVAYKISPVLTLPGNAQVVVPPEPACMYASTFVAGEVPMVGLAPDFKAIDTPTGTVDRVHVQLVVYDPAAPATWCIHAA